MHPVTKALSMRPSWPAIAQDLVMSQMSGDVVCGTGITIDDICVTHGMSREVLNAMLENVGFQMLLRDVKGRVDAYGDNASFKLRAQMLAADLMEDMYISAKRATEPREKREAFKMLMQAGYDSASARGAVDDSSRQAQVVINIPQGIPGVTAVPVLGKDVISGVSTTQEL